MISSEVSRFGAVIVGVIGVECVVIEISIEQINVCMLLFIAQTKTLDVSQSLKEGRSQAMWLNASSSWSRVLIAPPQP